MTDDLWCGNCGATDNEPCCQLGSEYLAGYAAGVEAALSQFTKESQTTQEHDGSLYEATRLVSEWV